MPITSSLRRYISLNSLLFVLCLSVIFSVDLSSQSRGKRAKVIAFYDGEDDRGHQSFVHEANRWFQSISGKYNFIYDSTNDWNNLNDRYLSDYKVIIFLDARPDSLPQRASFERFIKRGGGFIGFHFSAFALTPSKFPQNWDWYHNQFIGAGEYKVNTWRPTSAILRVEDRNHPATKNLPATFKASPNEWYSWKNDLRNNRDIKILISIDSSSFPLGTGPKPYEIWHSGYYPVVWTNINYNMLYINMGHNDIDYEGKTNRELSKTFENEIQNRLVIDELNWLLSSKGANIKQKLSY